MGGESGLPAVTFIVPVYNETGRLGRTIGQIIEFVGTRPGWDLIFVDDGSQDGTCEVIQNAIANVPHAKVIRYSPNRGKGGAIREGMKHAHGDIVVFMDVDLSTPLSTTESFLDAFHEDGVSVVIGTRKTTGASIQTHQPWIRELLGEVFRQFSRWMVPGVSDFTCGFKAFRREVGQRLFALGRVDDWSFDTEILFLATRLGYRIREVPVHWHHEEASKVRVIRNGLVCLYQLIVIPIRYAVGVYETDRVG